VRHGEVQRAEVVAKGLVDKFLGERYVVHAEVVGVGAIARGRTVTDPVQTVWVESTRDDFDGEGLRLDH